jgi:hypothetical protein
MVSFSSLVVRISELESLTSRIGQLTLPAALPQPLQPPSGASFARTLASATQLAPAAYGGQGGRIVAAAQGEVGQGEQPPGSNDGSRIALYRSAVAGAQAGVPWCAYFASWAAAQAGTPLGDTGAGFGSVAATADWAARTGQLLPATAVPQAGDLILFGTRHLGIVESVNQDGSLTTIEGNHADAVQRVHRISGDATGFVRLG